MDSIVMVITLVLQLVLGKIIKNNPRIANGLIFWINWGLGIITNVIAPYVTPAAHAATADSLHTSVVHTVASTIFLNPFVLGFIQSVIATGIHSASKNTWEMFKSTFGFGHPNAL